LNTTSTAASAAGSPPRRALPPEKVKILLDCRDIAIERLVAAFTGMLDKVIDMLVERSGKTDIREEQQVMLDARLALLRERGPLMTQFEQRLRGLFDTRIEGKDAKAAFSSLDGSQLSLVDHMSMDETVITSNIVRVVENSAHEELIAFNRGIGSLLESPGLETDANPLAPATIVEAFAEALSGVKAGDKIRFQILKELNQTSLIDIAAIYADLLVPVSEWENWPSSSRSQPHFSLSNLPPVLRVELAVFKVLVIPPGWVAAKVSGFSTAYAEQYVTPRDIGETAGTPPFVFAMQNFRWAVPFWFALLVVLFEAQIALRRLRRPTRR